MNVARSVSPWVIAAVVFSMLSTSAVVVAVPLVTGDLSIYYDFDSFTDTVMDGSGNGFNGKVKDKTRNNLDNSPDFRDPLLTEGVITNDTSNPKRGAGAIRFTQSDIFGDSPVFVDMDGGVIKATAPTKVPSQAVTMAAWLNIPEVRTDIGGDYNWNNPASVVQASSAGPGHITHFHAEGAGNIRLALRNEAGTGMINSSAAPFSGHPYPNQPEIDGSGATPEPWPFNEWFHLAFTYDKNANGGAGEFAMYFNGEKIRGGAPNDVAGADFIGAWDYRTGFEYYDGLGIGAVYDSGGRRLHGMMDELYIFTRALSEEEIGTLAMQAVPGDQDGDDDVDGNDLLIIQRGMGTTHDVDDLTAWKANFGAAPSAAAAGAVPEPATILLAAIAVVGLGARRLRRNLYS